MWFKQWFYMLDDDEFTRAEKGLSLDLRHELLLPESGEYYRRFCPF